MSVRERECVCVIERESVRESEGGSEGMLERERERYDQTQHVHLGEILRFRM